MDNEILQQDGFYEFLTSNYDPDISNKKVDEDQFNFNIISFKNAGDFSYVVDQVYDYATSGLMSVIGNILLNQCSTFLTRNLYEIKGGSRPKYFQRISGTTIGRSITLLYP